jgi:quercetin dioxygenase-like cupin family protein
MANRFPRELLLRDAERCMRVQWPAHFNQRDYSGRWSSIALRSASGDASDITSVPGQSHYRDTALLDECPYFRTVLDGFLCDKETVRLLRLEPGSEIHEHRDPGASYADGFFRLHVPITSNAETRFLVDGEALLMQPGECWYVDFGLPHSVRNSGETDRIHLTIDGLRNEWSDRLFERAGYDFVEDARARSMDSDTTRRVIETLRARGTETDLRLAEELERESAGR